MIIIDEYSQGTPQWRDALIGNPGASSFKRIVTTKGEPSKSREEYMMELAGEVVTGEKTETYSNKRMEDALILEDESRANYEYYHDVDIRQVAICYPDEEKRYHASPDGLIVGESGGFETKDAIPKVQIKRLYKGTLPTEHYTQCQGSLLVTGYDYWIFQSYCRKMPPLTLTIKRDEKFISALARELDKFCLELAQMIRKIKEMG